MRILRPLSTVCLVLLAACQPKHDPHAMRLKLLADTQQRMNDEALKAGERTLMGLKALVEKNRNQPNDMVVVERAERILKQTKFVVSQLRNIQATLRNQSAGKNEIHLLSEHEPVVNILLSASSISSTDSLYSQLTSFVHFIRPFVGQAIEKSWLADKGAPSTSFEQIFSTTVSYRKFYYEDATVAEVLAVLAQQEAEILQLNNAALANQSQLLGSGWDGFSLIYAYAVAESNTVRVGAKYRADLLLLRSSGAAGNLTMRANELGVPVSKDGRGRVEFTVAQQLPAGRDTMRAFWNGAITLPVYGRDSTFRIRVSYTIYR